MDRDDQLAALAEVSELAAAAAVDLTPPVEHCPGWSVAELVVHLADVQWFWSNVVENRITSYEDVTRPPGPPDGVDPVVYLRSQSERLLAALEDTDDATELWTWFASEQNAEFVLRRQVLEAAVHAWDVQHAVDEADDIDTDIAELGLVEFCEVMALDRVPDAVAPVALSLEPTDTEWRGTLFGETDPIVALSAPASDLLLLLWGRNESGDDRVDQALATIDLS